MKKIIKSFVILFMVLFIAPIFVGCKNNRPSFNPPSTQTSTSNDNQNNSSDQNSSENNSSSSDSNTSNNNHPESDNDNNSNESNSNNNSPETTPSDSDDSTPSADNNNSNANSESTAPSESNTDSEYYNISFDEGIIVSSTTLTKDNNGNIKVKVGSQMKVYIDLEESGISEITSTNNEIFYYDSSTNSVISAIKINNQTIPLTLLNSYFTITNNTTINFVKSKLSLSSIIFCNKYSTDYNDTLYKKFNYKSSNFRHSLISLENDNVLVDESVYYLTFDNLTTTKNIKTNISCKVYFDTGIKSITAKIEAIKEAVEVSYAVLYRDENNNLFLSEVRQISEFSQENSAAKINSFSIFGDGYNFLNLEFVKYYLI